MRSSSEFWYIYLRKECFAFTKTTVLKLNPGFFCSLSMTADLTEKKIWLKPAQEALFIMFSWVELLFFLCVEQKRVLNAQWNGMLIFWLHILKFTGTPNAVCVFSAVLVKMTSRMSHKGLLVFTPPNKVTVVHAAVYTVLISSSQCVVKALATH